MATLMNGNAEDSRRAGNSPRPKGRENAKDTLCRNVTIYGHCRYEDKGCAFNHDPIKPQLPPNHTENIKKRFNVDSPSFTPSSLAVNGSNVTAKTPGLSPKAANAAPFRPRNLTPAPSAASSSVSLSSKPYNPNALDWISPEAQEFLPQAYTTNDNNSEYTQPNPFDSYATSTPAAPTPNPSDVQTNASLYAADTNGFQPTYFTHSNSSNQILNHHLYAPLEPQTNSNQKYGRDLFIPEDLRRRLLDKTEATLRTFSEVSRIPYVDPYHSLTPLEWNNRGSPTSTVYKAVHAQDGRTYCLRRFHDMEATDMNKLAIWDIRKTWSTIRNSSVVSLHLAFSTEKFGDHSVVIVSDYHPASKSFAEKYFSRSNRTPDPPIKGEVLWKYLIQIANALKEIHSKARSARFIDTSKVLVTDENRIRLNGCAIKDILEPQIGDIEELKRLDLYEFGKFMFAISSKPKTRAPPALDSHEITLRPIVQWLLDHHRPDNNQDIDQLLSQISTNIIKEFDATLAVDDKLQSYLNRELENSRILRLMTKLNFLNERPEYEKDNQWSSQGSRAILPLFRDYVFHSEDAQGNPVVDMGHVITCLNKLDVGVDEKLTLTTRDEHNVIVVSYKELRAMLDRAWADLMAKSSG